MELFKSTRSWRASRLSKKEGWKRLITHWDIWVSLVVVAISVWCMQSLKPTGITHVDMAFDILSIFALVGIFWGFVDTICAADDYYKITTRENGQVIFISKIYLYKRRANTYKMTIINDQRRNGYFGTSKTKFLIREYKVLKYTDSLFFFFTLADNRNCWYSLCNKANGEQKLGQRIDETLFYCEDTNLKKKLVYVLNNGEFASYYADQYFFDDVNILGNIYQEDNLADKYIILKNNNEYKVLGLYFKNKKEQPYCREEKNLSFSFSQEPNKLSLVSHQGIYTVGL